MIFLSGALPSQCKKKIYVPIIEETLCPIALAECFTHYNQITVVLFKLFVL